jgi:hypothetical protein
MSERKNLCVLVALHPVDAALADRLGADEAVHAAERHAKRIERAIVMQGGQVLFSSPEQTIAGFERSDAAVHATGEAIERLQALPPLQGLRQTVRIGLHYGRVDTDGAEPGGEGPLIARQLANLGSSGQALISGTAVMLLGGGARQLVGAQPLSGPVWSRVGIPVHAIGQRSGLVTSVPAAARLSSRLRLRHQQDVLFAEELRPVLLLGRELANDITIMDPRASRQHARIERRPEGFVLFDQSTNGTFVAIEGRPECFVRQEHILLDGPGRIGCGFSSTEVERDLVFFDIV